MPRRACWLLTTSPPSWNRAPPPLMSKLKLVSSPSSTVRLKSKVAVLMLRVLPLALAEHH